MTSTLTPSDFQGRKSTTTGVSLIAKGQRDPREYLRFAEQDLGDEDSARTRINALSNTKRALHLQITLLTDAFGYKKWSNRKPEGFPKRLAFLELCSLIAPRLLAKINRLRNAVEHDYADPDRSTVEDYTEIVALYLYASDRVARSFTLRCETYTGSWKDHVHYCVCTKIGSGTIKLYKSDMIGLVKALPESNKPNSTLPADREPEGLVPLLEITLDQDEARFFEWVRFLVEPGSIALT